MTTATYDALYRPRLRPVEAVPVEGNGGVTIALRDRSGLSNVLLSTSQAALVVMSLMDGRRTCAEIIEEFRAEVGRPLPEHTLGRLLDHLDRAHFLEGPTFEDFYQQRLVAYRAAPMRDMPHAASLGINDDSGEPFESMIHSRRPQLVRGTVCGIVAPHLDYARGAPCYIAAYGALRGRRRPERVVILGTNHFGRASSVVATGKDFSTPLGVTRCDTDFLERLESSAGPLRTYELDHVREHSVELQLPWLQYLFGAEQFTMVAILCPDPCGPTGTAPLFGDGPDLRVFAEALGDAIRTDAADTLIVAGADLSHVGEAFGDEALLDEAFLAHVKRRDEAALEALTRNDPETFRRCIAREDNPTRVCSAGSIYALLTALPEAQASLLEYHQAVDVAAQSCVTCTALVLTQ